MGTVLRIGSQCRRRRRGGRRWPIVPGRKRGSGGASNRIRSAQPDPGDHQRSGVIYHSIESPSGQRATAAPEEDEACSPAQASAYAGTSSGPDRDQETGNTYITSRSVPNYKNPCLPPRPNPSAWHSYLPARSKPSTRHTHKREHGRGSGHGT